MKYIKLVIVNLLSVGCFCALYSQERIRKYDVFEKVTSSILRSETPIPKQI